jgi:ABC-type branched-subunit amino acid transport system substrate-binding protein
MKIGISLPRSAPQDADIRSVGNDVGRALRLAQDALGTAHDLIERDNENSAARAAEIVAEFVALGVDGVLGLPTSDEVLGSADALSRAGLCAITSMATSPALAILPHVFRTRPGDGHACAVLVEHLKCLSARLHPRAD